MKGQVGIEFLAYVSFVLVLLSIFLYSSYSKQSQLMKIKIDNELREIADGAEFEINAAVRAGDGYQRRFNMKSYYQTLNDFNITIREGLVEVSFGNRYYYGNLLTKKIVGNLTKEWNIVRNEGGTIYVN
jgi:hypothetical protein